MYINNSCRSHITNKNPGQKTVILMYRWTKWQLVSFLTTLDTQTTYWLSFLGHLDQRMLRLCHPDVFTPHLHFVQVSNR